MFDRILFRCVCVVFCLACALPIHAREIVKVGLYHFPPFIVNEGEEVGGLATQMLALMNAHQDEYEFVAIATPPATRHEVMALGRYDMSMFEQPEWGWQDMDVDFSEVFLEGGEVYIAQADPERGQDYFQDFKNKRMIAVEGYHYRFSNFNSDPVYLNEHFNIILTPSNLGSIQLLLEGERGDIAVVTQSFLAQYLMAHPEDRQKLLISEEQDQAYHLRIALRKGLSFNVEKLNQLLKELEDNGQFEPLWQSIRYDFNIISPHQVADQGSP